ncbi:MAG: carboxylating nicotinate-nucleotide diphosphorylase [Gammaproteobacteria bacterium]
MHPQYIAEMVSRALSEDVGVGDVTASLIPEDKIAYGSIVCRESAVLCGQAWVNEVFAQCDTGIEIDWKVRDGDVLSKDMTVCELRGNARALLTGERAALNFLQTLSGTATITQQYVGKLLGTKTKLLDTRKTIPGFRHAQKYAVKCGGGENHRMGLYDAFLIKENHIHACGSIRGAIEKAREVAANKICEVEVENLKELEEALAAKPDIVMLDNFSLDEISKAVAMTKGRVKLEISGNVSLDNIHNYANTGVDYISVGAITKHVRAIDFSMRFSSNV